VLGGHLRHYIRYQLYNNYFTSVEKTTFIIDDVFSEQFFNIIRRQRRHLSIMMAFSPIHDTFSTGLSRTESFSFQQYSNNDFFHNFSGHGSIPFQALILRHFQLSLFSLFFQGTVRFRPTLRIIRWFDSTLQHILL
jgi:hypothetical protein